MKEIIFQLEQEPELPPENSFYRKNLQSYRLRNPTLPVPVGNWKVCAAKNRKLVIATLRPSFSERTTKNRLSLDLLAKSLNLSLDLLPIERVLSLDL